MIREYRSILWEDVRDDQELPEITYELSLLRLVAFVRACGQYDFVHFDRDYAQSVGARDVFAATPHVLGLFSRLLTDWSGPDADIRTITLNMRTQSCAGDMLRVTGKVARKYISADGEYLVDIDALNIGHQHSAQAATATATLCLPSRAGGPVRLRSQPPARHHVELDPALPDFARELIGTVKPGAPEPAWPLTRDEIHMWCECLEDWNPLYWDPDFAATSRYGGIVAPPASLFHGAGSSVRVGLGYMKPEVTAPAAIKAGLQGLPLLKELRKVLLNEITPFAVPGCPEIAVAQARSDYFTSLHPGDTTRTTQEVLNCSPLKRTKLGEGHFLTWVRSVYNQSDVLVRTFTLTGFYYHT